MRIFCVALLLAGLVSCDLTVGDECGSTPFKVVKEQLTSSTPIPDVDSIMFNAIPLPEVQVVSVPASDSIRFEFEITKHFRVRDTTVLIQYAIDEPNRRMIIRSDFIHISFTSPLRSAVECTPAPDHAEISKAKVFMPEGVNIRISSR